MQCNKNDEMIPYELGCIVAIKFVSNVFFDPLSSSLCLFYAIVCESVG